MQRWTGAMVGLLLAASLHAAEIRVISGGAAKAFVQPLVETFRIESGHSEAT